MVKIKWPWSKAKSAEKVQPITLKWNGVEIVDELEPEDHALIDGQPVASFRTLRSDAKLLEALLNRELFLSEPRGGGGGGIGFTIGAGGNWPDEGHVVMRAWGGHGSSEK